MKPQVSPAIKGGNRFRLLYATVAMSFCLAGIAPAAFADATPDASGFVTCNIEYPDATSATIQYPVELFGNTVVGRWGPDRDTSYGMKFAGGSANGRNLSVFWWSVFEPDPECTVPERCERYYSETGKMDYKVNKNGTMNISGKSFVAMEYYFVPFPPNLGDWVDLAAECTWKLTGSLPPG